MKMTMPSLAAVSLVIVGAGCYNPPPKYAAVPPSTPTYTPPSVRYDTTPVYKPAVSLGQGAVSASEIQNASDQELATSVRHQFDRYGDLSGLSPNIHIVANNGTVSLTGTVPTEKDRQMVDALVRNSPGVVRLNNSLHVDDPRASYTAPTGTEATRVYSSSTPDMVNLHVQTMSDRDWELAQGILASLRTGTTPGETFAPVHIYVADGKAMVRGTVANETERQTIINAIQRAAGAGNVQSELVVKP